MNDHRKAHAARELALLVQQTRDAMRRYYDEHGIEGSLAECHELDRKLTATVDAILNDTTETNE